MGTAFVCIKEKTGPLGENRFNETVVERKADCVRVTNQLMKLPFTGGCACGAIRYECTAEPIMMFKCHCRDCQKVTGGAFVPGLLVAASAFRLTKGELRYHFTPSAAGGRHKRGFCAECGSRITGGENGRRSAQLIGVTAGSLDDPTWFCPQMDIFVCDAQPWDQTDSAIPKYDQYPPMA
jgi:hypothetical protein